MKKCILLLLSLGSLIFAVGDQQKLKQERKKIYELVKETLIKEA